MVRFTIGAAIVLIFAAVSIYLLMLIIKALKTYIRSKEVREERTRTATSLEEVLKQHRIERKMTQEFVAEAIGVSRQAVSKWESGLSDSSTTNLMAIAKLLGLTPEDLIREAQSG